MTSQDSMLDMQALSGEQTRRISAFLRESMADCSGLYVSALCSIDGHELIHEMSRAISSSRLAAMSSSILALAETLAAEADQQACRFVILENSNGRVVTVRVNQRLLLTCMANHDSNLGVLLRVGRETANKIGKIFENGS